MTIFFSGWMGSRDWEFENYSFEMYSGTFDLAVPSEQKVLCIGKGSPGYPFPPPRDIFSLKVFFITLSCIFDSF